MLKKLERRKPFLMIVEDDADIRQALAAVFEDSGYDVTVAIDGQDALDQLAARKNANRHLPDVILTDLVMPRMNGHDFLKLLAYDDILGCTPRVIMSASRSDGLSFRFYLPKPLDLEDVLQAVKSALTDTGLFCTEKARKARRAYDLQAA